MLLEILNKLFANILDMLYKPIGYVALSAILFMFLYLYVKEIGWKKALFRWVDSFKTCSKFRKLFFLSLYTMLVLSCTVFNRSIWKNPMCNVIGVWGIYNAKGELTIENFENFILFIPFIILFLRYFSEEVKEPTIKLFVILKRSIIVVFLFSLMIETIQLLFHLGTFQMSDLFYNTLGGSAGGLIYWICYKVIHRNRV